ncbi:class I SAM-dependent methyltransferase [Gracilinema caldarium]|uniref:rRNA (Guanine-N(2)-)-methyltransferase n=1 Tax=Gracilinema caldarium (strain ATCC 51460 / DSM 7334 / H1) TaxID=744872 RepID=F8F0N7_GRAC1|nr:class I SAM-dependent methyltransferase [Gracilinema caldarium]AEJ19744.1 rRNA (guanine-N(2)-)-methyltransferase [Gracilinema caldarium DSM 7334]
MFTIQKEKTNYQAELLRNRLTKRYKHLRKWAKRVGVDAYRLYDRDIPEIPLLIDLYGDAVSGALYERPYEKDQQEEAVWLSIMKHVIAETLELSIDQIFIKERKRLRNRAEGPAQYQKIDSKTVIRQVHEGGLTFQVNLSDYLDTGLFLDHRLSRAYIRNESKGRRVLNLFCYTGSFSVYAASGGASQVDSVDLSNTYLDWAHINFKLNGFASDHIAPEDYVKGPQQRGKNLLIRADVLRFLQEAVKRKLHWDLIVLDPPTFSNSKKMADILDIRRDYKELIDLCLTVLNPQGLLLFSTNARSFHFDSEYFVSTYQRIVIKDITRTTVDEDFRDKKVRLCYTLEK